MPIPMAYEYKHKPGSDFTYPRTPPTPGRYSAPMFEKTDLVVDQSRSHYVSWMSDGTRHHLIAMIGEFVGTMMFLFFGFVAAQTANNKPDTLLRLNFLSDASLLQLTYISLGFGVGLAVNIWLFYRVSGGQFNTAVTIGLCLAGVFGWTRCMLLIFAQLLGAVAAAVLVSALFPGPMMVQAKLGSGTTTAQGLFIEAILTAELMFTVLMLAVEKHRATFLAPLGIGMTIFVDVLISANFSGGSLNPARAFGPAVVLGEFVPYHWIYWLGPVMGTLLAVGLYKLLKVLQYETANAGQDDDGLDVYRLTAPRYQRRRNSNESITSLTPFAINK